MSIHHILEILDRAHNGPICTAKEFTTKILPSKVAQKLKEHGLCSTLDKENPINTDDQLADQFFKAGFELAVEVGCLCQDTERVIKVTEEELANALRHAPSKLAVGKGCDLVVLRHRRPEDPLQPLFAAPMGNLVSEDIWVHLHQGIVQQREIDIFQGSSIVTIFGRPVLAGTPYETLVGRYRAQLTKEVLWRAGRPGMATLAVAASPTVFAHLGGFGVPGGFDPEVDIAELFIPGEMQTSYTTLHKVVHAINCGAKIFMGYATVIGGYAGPPEGTALSRIATVLLQHAVHEALFTGGSVIDVRYAGNCGREGQWAHSVSSQALYRNTHMLGMDVQNQVAGPCTEMFLHECAVAMINASVSGATWMLTPRSSGVKHADHLTPLECRFCAEVFKRSAGMTRKKANEIAKVLIPKYETMLWDPPKGKSVQECYDLNTFKPSQEWQDIYLKVKKELIDLGVPLEYP